MTKLRRTLAVCLAILLTVLVLPTDFPQLEANAVWDGSTASSFAGGSGTAQSPYVIETASQLAYLASAVNGGNTTLASAYYVLNADIQLNDASEYSKWYRPVGSDVDGEATASDEDWFGTGSDNGSVVPDNAWAPIGNAVHPFSGNFNGNGHCISGLYCVCENGYAGLFGKNTGTVNYISTVDSIVVSGDDYAGGIIAYNAGTASKLANTGKVISSADFVGGIIGYNSGAVSDIASYGVVNGGYNVGGCVGANYDGTVTRALTTGTVDGGNYEGAAVGFSKVKESVTSSYYRNGACEGDEAAAGVAENVLKSGASFTNWSNWTFASGNYPVITGLHLEIAHNFSTEWTTSETEHWHACTDDGCTAKDSLGYHIGGTATCTEKAVCTTCGVSYGDYGAHDPEHVAANNATHSSAGNIEYWYCGNCDGCFSDADCTNPITQAQTVIAQIPHSYAKEWSSDASSHWHECECGAKADTASHTYDNACDTDCNVCGKTRTVTHNYEWVSDADGHKQVCSICFDTINEGEHVYASDFDVDCESCGYVRTLGVITGDCGNNTTYEYDTSEKSLVISGVGAVTETPWAEAAADITTITVLESVSEIPSGAFAGCTSLETVFIEGNPEIADDAFTDCDNAVFTGWHYTDIYDICEENGYEFIGWEDFRGLGIQLNNSELTKFRLIAAMIRADKYETAGFEITAVGSDGLGNDFNKSMDKGITTVYKTISASSGGVTYTALPELDNDGYYTALVMSGPSQMGDGGKIIFSFRPYVTNLYSDTKVYFDVVKVVYEKNSIRPYDPDIDDVVPFHTDEGEDEGGVIDWNLV